MTTYDVFISYSNKDKSTADALCATLESKGLRCWIAPRDILPGADWGESIIGGIEQCRAMVLVFSSHANESPQVKREVERAVSKGIAIIPFRIENVALSRSMEYFISSQHWLDALTPPVQKHLIILAEKVRHLLDHPGTTPRPPGSGDGTRAMPPSSRSLRWLGGVGIVMLLAVVAYLVWPRKLDPATKLDAPTTPQIAARVNLMPHIDLNSDKRKGVWISKQGRLYGQASLADEKPLFVLSLPWEPPDEYRLKFTVTRQNKEEGFLGVGLGAGPGRFSVLVDLPKDKKYFIGLTSSRPDKLAEGALARTDRLLTHGASVPIVCTVETRKLTVEAQGTQVFRWSGDLTQLGQGRTKRPLQVYGVSKAVFSFEDIVLEPLGPNQGKLLTGDTE